MATIDVRIDNGQTESNSYKFDCSNDCIVCDDGEVKLMSEGMGEVTLCAYDDSDFLITAIKLAVKEFKDNN